MRSVAYNVRCKIYKSIGMHSPAVQGAFFSRSLTSQHLHMQLEIKITKNSSKNNRNDDDDDELPC